MNNYAQGFVIAAIGVAVGLGIAWVSFPKPQWDGVKLPTRLAEGIAGATYIEAVDVAIDCRMDRHYRLRNMELCAALDRHEKEAQVAMDALTFMMDHGMIEVPDEP